ncbi:fibronectin type III domain-containing protein [bacterium]|nr:fibronectin type III domain-containing protein [bacterium]
MKHSLPSFLTLFLSLTIIMCTGSLQAQRVLVDFGANAGGNSFEVSGWNTLIKSDAVDYTADGPGGLVSDVSADEYSDYMGVSGISRAFTVADCIVVTWYNRSDETVRFTARISFTDTDQPDGGNSDGAWFTMRSAEDYRETWTELAPGETGQTMFAIAPAGVHATMGSFNLVNVNCAIEWGASDQKSFLVCDKIELARADVRAPSIPSGLRTVQVTDSQVQLQWNDAADNVGVVEYFVYADGLVEGYTRENSHTCVFLEPETDYRFTVTARDMMGNESAHSEELTVTTESFAGDATQLQPAGMEYRGAFRLPEDFNWGGEAIAYGQDGDGGQSGAGSGDGYPGSLFVSNLNQPENGLVGEISIPAPLQATTGIEALPVAAVLQQPVNIRPSDINNWDYVDIWRTGLEYLPSDQRLYSAWSIHYTVTGEKHASISCCPADNLSGGPYAGAWYVGDAGTPPIDAQMSDWLFAVPDAWAQDHTDGRQLVVGRFRDGGLSGLGPTMYAIPSAGASPPGQGSELDFTRLLEYGPVQNSDNYHFPDAIDGYKHSDEWREACWLEAGEQSAIAVVGRKAFGDNWYGYHGEQMRHDWVIADVPYPEFYETDPDGKGWRAHLMRPMIVFYNADDLADVADGVSSPHEPQPYAALRIDGRIFFGSEQEIFSAAYDPINHFLYVLEFVRSSEGSLVAHVFETKEVAVNDAARDMRHPSDIQLDVYPQPAGDILNIVCSGEAGAAMHITLSDALGRTRILYDGRMPQGGLRISRDIASLSAGPVFVVLRTSEGIRCRRLMKL